jgi:hypothetical protein
MPTDGSQGGGTLSKYPVTYVFAGMVLLSLVVLAVLRHLTGTISISAGTK